ncbi:MAG: metallophosphoesterase, partial [Alphaproteobacteria bacterium]
MLKWLTGRARHQTSPADGPDNRRPHPPARLLSRLPARVPAGCRVYAIGDIHGRRDLLNQLHQAITADAATAPARRILIHLGDLVDRGPDSRGVIDSLLRPLAGFETVNLKGNHEDLLLRFLDDPAMGAMWLANGGRETLLSYGVTASGTEDAAGLLRCQLAFRERLSTPHLSFLRQLAISHSEGDYHFVHAGVRPGVPLDAQS